MRLYRFSPVSNEKELRAALTHIHAACMKLCEKTLGVRLPNSGNIAYFCHYEDEYQHLLELSLSLTTQNTHPLKYRQLQEPLNINKLTYSHLYIRRPDPYRHHVGDIDLLIAQEEYNKLKQRLLDGESIKGVRIYPGDSLDMIELYDPDSDVLAYLTPQRLHN